MKIIFFIFLTFILHFSLFAQNIFDFEHSFKFAKFLYSEQYFTNSAHEFQRLYQLHPCNDSVLFWTLKSVGKAKCLKKNIFDTTIIKNSVDLSLVYANMLMQNKAFQQNIEFINQNTKLDISTKNDLKVQNFILQSDLKNAISLANSYHLTNKHLLFLLDKQNQPKHKSPLLSFVLSSLVPGTGKMYVGRYGDALSTFLLVAVNFWQAYTGFEKFGQNHLYPWFFVSLGTSYYLGNLYGSYHLADQFNKIENEKYAKNADVLLFFDH